MIPIVFSYHLPLYGEIEIVNQLFKHGLELFHLRKHNFSLQQMEEYLCKISIDYRNRIILHSHFDLIEKYHLKGSHVSTILPTEKSECIQPHWYKSTFCYNLEDIRFLDSEFDQIIIGPVFKSISNPEYYNCKYNHKLLHQFFQENDLNHKIIAIGGIDALSAQIALNIGFNGVATLGAIWTTYLETFNINQTLYKFLKIKESCLQFCN